MDKVQPTEGLDLNNDVLKQPEQPGGFEVSPKIIQSAKERLKTILAKKEIAPNLADEIRQKLEDIESGKVSAVASDELAKAIEKLEQIERQTLSENPGLPAGMIVNYLNDNSKADFFKKADELGAGYEATQSLMAQTAKKYAEENKS